MLFRIYNLLFPLAFFVALPGYLRRMVRRGDYRKNFGQRLGWYSPEARDQLARTSGALWLEAVSVGEMLVALKLLQALRARDPDVPLVISTTTTTGYALASNRVPPGVPVIYTPIDSGGAVRRAFAAIAPAQLIIVDGGLWLNQLREARCLGVPTALVNARLSPRSERRFRRFLPLVRPLFEHLDLVAVPESGDVERWASLGVPCERIQITGSIKFDDAISLTSPVPSYHPQRGPAAPREFLQTLGILPGAPIWLAASTHPGEERAVGEIFVRLRGRFPDLRLIVAPRHVERTGEVRTALTDLGLKVAQRTHPPEMQGDVPDVLLLDTTGELRAWYTVATVAFIGKSLLAIGGQNPAEAVMAGVPVVFGPHMENFAELAARLLTAGAAMQAENAAALEACSARLLASPAQRADMAAAARRQIASHRGASERTAEILLPTRQNSPCQAP